jgi:hypothetical protein
MVLREKLRSTKMSKTGIVALYLTKISQVRDEIMVVGEIVKDDKPVRTTLYGFSEKWASFVKGVVAREHLHDWQSLWDDFSQDETREEALQGS